MIIGEILDTRQYISNFILLFVDLSIIVEMVYGWNVPLRSTWKFFKQATIILSKSLQAGQASTVQLNQ
jgi:hypothetical protein